tara:strand:+ start:462 stop:803 length:342 start_codon:yes stop_codon:yes gene_type:complete
MDIEPLQSILEWSKDKKSTLLHFLPVDVKKKVIQCDYEEDTFYINDRIYCIKKNTFELEIIGKILFVEENRLGIKITTTKTLYINPKKYYIFVKCKKTISKQRDFMKQLLEQL